MAIPGYIRKRLARIGKIKLGPPVRKGSNEHPDDLTYFVVPEEVAAVYGEQPTELDVRVPSPDIEKFCPITLQQWNTQQKKVCGSLDSETAHEWQDAAAGFVEIPCAYKDCEHYRSGACCEVGDLYVVLPKVDIAGVYHIATKSVNGLGYIYNEFETFVAQFDNATNGEGDITRVDFTLSRVPEITNPFVAKFGKRVSSSHAMLHLRTTDRLSDDKAKALSAHFRAHQDALEGASDVPALPPADEDDEGILDGEFEPGEETECPADLVAGASPVGPDLVQKDAWAALLEQVQELGKNLPAFEKSVCQAVVPGVTRFEDLAGATEAQQALDQGAAMIATWQRNGNGPPPPKEKAAAKPAAPKPAAKTNGNGAKAGDEGLGF